jgi:phosphoribosylformylglycinamidine (FGAM) synthase PurS component
VVHPDVISPNRYYVPIALERRSGFSVTGMVPSFIITVLSPAYHSVTAFNRAIFSCHYLKHRAILTGEVQSVHMTSYIHRIEVHYTVDPRLAVRTDRIRSLGFPVDTLHLIDVYTIATSSRDFTPDELSQIGEQLINPVVQEYTVDKATSAVFDYAIEVGFLPGVTDNVGTTARQTIEDYFSMTFCEDEAVYTSQLFFVCGNLPAANLQKLASTLANPLVNRVMMKTRQEYGNKGMDPVVPFVHLHELPTAETVDLDQIGRASCRERV